MRRGWLAGCGVIWRDAPSEEIVWLRENVLKKGPKDNPPYADAAKRLAELYAQNYPGVEEQG